MIRVATLALAFACLLLLPAAAKAAWTAPTVVSGLGSSVSQTRIAGASDGNSWVLWKRNVGGFDVIQGTKVAPDGTQGAIQTISGPTSQATDPVIASRADGSAIVAWLNTSALDDTVHSRSIAVDGTFGPIETRSAVGPIGQPAADLAVAVGDDGTAGIAWRKFVGANWIAQAVKVAADGTSGTIHNLSEAGVSVNEAPDIAAAPPLAIGQPNSYRIVWTQGTAATSNVGSREISSADALGDLWLAFPEGGGDPFDANIAYGSDGSMGLMWIRYREDLNPNDGTPYYNWAVESASAGRGQPPSAFVTAVSPTVFGTPYNLSALSLAESFGALPTVVWVHDLNGGGYRVETGRLTPAITGPTYQAWNNASGTLTGAVEPVIRSNASSAAIAGWTTPGVLPNQGTVGWSRFSNTFAESTTPTGTFLYTEDPGFAIANDGRTLAAFTAIDGGAIGTARVMSFTNRVMSVSPNSLLYGRVDIGETATRFVTVRSAGQTPLDVTGISLSGPGQAQYDLPDPSSCIKSYTPGLNCQVQVRFRPTSTSTANASLTITSDAGNQVVSLTGSGLNRTRNRITASPRNKAVRKGKVVRIKVKAQNVGGVTSNNTRICVNLRKRVLKLAGNRCRSLGNLPAGATRNLNYRVRVTWRAKRGTRYPVTFQMRSNNTVVRQVVVQLRRKG